jgi:hypothetical protein
MDSQTQQQVPYGKLPGVPLILYLRLSRRNSVKYFIIYYFVLLLGMTVFGILFLNSVYVTRHYIVNPDKFWKQVLQHNYLLSLQKYCAFTGIFLICLSAFLIMNNILVVVHVYYGGLQRRLQVANYIFIIFQSCLFVYSFIMLIMFKGLITLFPALFVFSIFNFLSAIIYFLLLRRSYRRENPFMLSIDRMERHKNEYYQEYLSKKDLNDIQNNDNEHQD